MQGNRPRTKLLVDGGDPDETVHVKELIGFVDGQTTNPSLIAKNPEVQQLLQSGQRLSTEEQQEEYKKIVQKISPIVGDAGVSIEVFADLNTTAEQMLAQGQEMFAWIPNAYIKYPCTHEGLRAAHVSVEKGIRVNMTLCFSQDQAAAVYSATRGTKDPVYVSPFIGRLDDQGQNGMDVVKNILKMYRAGDIMCASWPRAYGTLTIYFAHSHCMPNWRPCLPKFWKSGPRRALLCQMKALFTTQRIRNETTSSRLNTRNSISMLPGRVLIFATN